MDELISLRSNPFYLKIDNEYEKYHNLVFVTAQAHYELSNDREVIRKRSLNRTQITVANDDIDRIIGMLEELKEKERADLK